MKLKTLIIENLYGYLDKKIDFNDDINILVGINGSGKTTVLNVINWLIRPSLGYLSIHVYEKLSLTFVWREKEYEIVATQNDVEMLLNITNVTDKKHYHKINVRFKIHPSKIINSDATIDSLLSDYAGLSAEDHELETWRLIFGTIPNPIIIGLDRNLYIEDDGDYLIKEDSLSKKVNREKGQQTANPLEKVKQLTQKRYSFYKSRLIDLNTRLNDNIMLSSFDKVLTEASFSELNEQGSITVEQVDNLHKKVRDYFEENIIRKRAGLKKHINEASESKIEEYFTSLKQIIRDANESKDKVNFMYIANITQFIKLKGLINEFEEFEAKSSKFYEPIRDYLEVLNSFFIDSSKRLYFDKNTSELKFSILNKFGETKLNDRDIKSLSSGEKQILILFTYLKFNNKEERIFIIDEPEISLHPKWQADFLPAVEKLSKEKSQLIIATHSPNVVSKNKDYCKILLPYND